MGVPGFFAWLIRHYKEPKIIKNSLDSRPKILYIDSNCLFHPQCFKIMENCSDQKNLDKLETMMFKRIINYINYLVNFVNPEETVYISVDGVAPLAKIKQQRIRRFKSIEDNINKNKIKEKYGIESNSIWNNTKITPGTDFMERLHKKIHTYYEKKVKEDKDISYNIVYSSYHTPGEGEHKILEDIKEKLKIPSKINDTYIVYGLDADLFFLSMASKKNNLFLLREASQLDFKVTNNELYDPVEDVAEELKYVSVDRTIECYNEQIKYILNKKNERYNYKIKVDNFINDFVFICYLLGNDFLPHLPSVDIKKGGLDFILDCYCEIILKVQTNLIYLDTSSSKGKREVKINMIFFEELMRLMSCKENYYFVNILPDYQQMALKKKCPNNDPMSIELWEYDYMKNIKIDDPIKLGIDKPEDWKYRYYQHYFGINKLNYKELVNKLCDNYLEGLMWVTKYYFETCPSWRWQYNFLHAPFLSDIYNYMRSNSIDMNNYTFDKEQPLTPSIQLLSVLPIYCSGEITPSYRKLIESKDSPIIDMFPSKVEVDYLYKDIIWQAIPQLPNLNINRVLEAVKNIKLTEKEKKYNSLLDNFVFSKK